MLVGNNIKYGNIIIKKAGVATRLIRTDEKTCNITIKALHENNGMIYIGDKKVSSNNGYMLDSGEEITLVVDNSMTNIYINSEKNNDGVCYICCHKK